MCSLKLMPVLLAAVLVIQPAASAAMEAAAPTSVVQPTETAQGYVIIVSPDAEILVGPSEEYGILEVATEGEILPVMGKTGNWYYVHTTETGFGWIHGDSLAPYEYPRFLLVWQPPESWVPPSPDWVPPPDWVPLHGWVKRPEGWVPPPRWKPPFWEKWYKAVPRTPLAPRRPLLPPRRPRPPLPHPPPHRR